MNNIKNDKKISFINCNEKGLFNCYGSISDLLCLYGFISYKLLKNGINIKYLISELCNANDLFNDLK